MKMILIAAGTAAQLAAYALILFVSIWTGIALLLISYAAFTLVIIQLWKEAKEEKKEEHWNDYRDY